MKRIITILFLAVLIQTAYTQTGSVGINTTAPKATLDIKPDPDRVSANQPSGILIPRLTGDQIKGMKGMEASTMVYASSAATSTEGTAVNVNAPGFYFYDGNVWTAVASKTDLNKRWERGGNTGSGSTLLGTKDATALDLMTNHKTRVHIDGVKDSINVNALLSVNNSVKISSARGIYGVRIDTKTTGGWARGYYFGEGSKRLGGYIGLGSVDKLNHLRIGEEYRNYIADFRLSDKRTYLLGTLGVGVPEPESKLHVKGDARFSREKGLQQYTEFRHDAAATRLVFNTENNNRKPSVFDVTVFDSGRPDQGTPDIGYQFRVKGRTKMSIKENGNAQVVGSIQVGNHQGGDDTATAGTIRYNATEDKFQGYSGSGWVDLHQ